MEENMNGLLYFEHNLLPRMFYKLGSALVEAIKEQKSGFIESAIKKSNSFDESYTLPYAADDFTFGLLHCFEHDCDMLMIQIPESDVVTSCRSIYMAWNHDWTSQFYYTVEKTQEGNYVYCGWTKDHSYMMFAPKVPEDKLLESRDLERLFSSPIDYNDITLLVEKNA